MGAGVAIPVAVVSRNRAEVEHRYRGGPYPTPRYYDGAWRDPETDQPLAEDDPRFDFHHWATSTQDVHDRMLKDGAFAPTVRPGQGSLQPPTPRRR